MHEKGYLALEYIAELSERRIKVIDCMPVTLITKVNLYRRLVKWMCESIMENPLTETEKCGTIDPDDYPDNKLLGC